MTGLPRHSVPDWVINLPTREGRTILDDLNKANGLLRRMLYLSYSQPQLDQHAVELLPLLRLFTEQYRTKAAIRLNFVRLPLYVQTIQKTFRLIFQFLSLNDEGIPFPPMFFSLSVCIEFFAFFLHENFRPGIGLLRSVEMSSVVKEVAPGQHAALSRRLNKFLQDSENSSAPPAERLERMRDARRILIFVFWNETVPDDFLFRSDPFAQASLIPPNASPSAPNDIPEDLPEEVLEALSFLDSYSDAYTALKKKTETLSTKFIGYLSLFKSDRQKLLRSAIFPPQSREVDRDPDTGISKSAIKTIVDLKLCFEKMGEFASKEFMMGTAKTLFVNVLGLYGEAHDFKSFGERFPEDADVVAYTDRLDTLCELAESVLKKAVRYESPDSYYEDPSADDLKSFFWMYVAPLYEDLTFKNTCIQMPATTIQLRRRGSVSRY